MDNYITPRPVRVLILDDDESDRYLIKRMLKKSDIECVFDEGATQEAAIALLKKNDYDLILLDNFMPPYEAVDNLRAFDQELDIDQLKILVISGTFSPMIANECKAFGALGFSMKDALTPALVRSIISDNASP